MLEVAIYPNREMYKAGIEVIEFERKDDVLPSDMNLIISMLLNGLVVVVKHKNEAE